MKNKLSDLQNYLFEQLDRLSNDDLKGEELNAEIKRSQAITNTAQAIINNSQNVLNAAKFLQNAGAATSTKENEVIKMLGGGDEPESV